MVLRWVAVLGVVLAVGTAGAAAPNATARKATSQKAASQKATSQKAARQAKPTAAAAKAGAADRRDVLLLLDGGPLLLRMHLELGGVSLAASRKKYVNGLIESLDRDSDGKLSRAEAAASPLFRTKQRPGAAQFLEGLKAASHLTRRDVEQTVDRLGGEAVAYRQDLSSSQNDVEVFKLLDADASGVLDSAELAAAGESIMSKDTDGDECVAFQEFFPPPSVDPLAPQAAPATPPPPTPLASVADLVRDAHEPLLPRRLLKKYDRNRDLHLVAAELGWPPERVSACDLDASGKLDAAELGRLAEATPDIELAVDLRAAGPDGAASTNGGVLAVRGATGARLDDSGRLDYARLGFDGAVVTFSLRNLDPFGSAVDSAMRQFNVLDADANGYLDKDETGTRIRFERGLFDLIDGDGDAKLFADEMKAYVRARCEPAATACRMNLYDTGYGFFMALDGNADGRVSQRERRQVAESLARLDRDGTVGIGQNEPVRHFHIEFVRGTFQLFGPSEQLVAQTPAFAQRRLTGPIWFQRMDKNNDGDLTWNEFLGPREAFHELDADTDTLIDPREAIATK